MQIKTLKSVFKQDFRVAKWGVYNYSGANKAKTGGRGGFLGIFFVFFVFGVRTGVRYLRVDMCESEYLTPPQGRSNLKFLRFGKVSDTRPSRSRPQVSDTSGDSKIKRMELHLPQSINFQGRKRNFKNIEHPKNSFQPFMLSRNPFKINI